MAARQCEKRADLTRTMERLLWTCSTHARTCLLLGLATGLLWPGLAYLMQPWLPHMVGVLLLITALRIGRRAALGAVQDLGWGLSAVTVLQLGVPLICFAGLWLAGLSGTPAALALVLATAAPAISGSPNLALMLGLDAGRMMQILILGTAVFPLTVLPLLVLFPTLGDPMTLILAALRVLLVIAVATAIGFAIRARAFPKPTPGQIKALDGASVLAFSVIVVGLMAPLNGALRSDPLGVLGWACLAFAISYGLQTLTLLTLRKSRLAAVAGPVAIGAGNRNIALFLVALPPETIAPLLIFIACWQLPMYLTPILLPRLYRWAL